MSKIKIKIKPGPFAVTMPAVLVGADVDGKANFMVAAFVGIVNMKPPSMGLGLSPTHRTCDGIVANQCFSVNIPSPAIVEATDYCGITSADKADKSRVFRTFYGELKHAPMIEECRLNVECKLIHTYAMEVDTLYIGEIVNAYADDGVLQDGKPDWSRIDPLLFTFPDMGYWRLGERVAQAWSVGKKHTPKS